MSALVSVFIGTCAFCLITSMSQLMQHHGCKSHLRDRNKLTGLDDRFDMVVDANDVILEKVVCIIQLYYVCIIQFNRFHWTDIVEVELLNVHLLCVVFV